MSTGAGKSGLEGALNAVAKVFRDRLIERYISLKQAFAEGNYDSCGVRAARFSEVMLRFLQNELTGSYTRFGTSIGNFDDECTALHRTPRSSGPDSFRLLIPKALKFVYSVRNKRGFGHESGDVDADIIDAETCMHITDWCMSELIRVVHTLSLEEAQSLLDSISTRRIPLVWDVLGRKRILDTKITFSEKTLLLLYSEHETGIPSEDLFSWTEHSNLAVFKRDVLRRLHKARYLEYDEEIEMVILSPKGIQKVEDELFKRLNNS